MKKSMLVFTGYNPRAVLTFIRTLEACNVPYALIAASEDDPIFLTTYAGKVKAIRTEKKLDLKDMLNSLSIASTKDRLSDCVIAPSTEALNRFLLKHRGAFTSSGYQVPLASKSVYETISDKQSFGELCEERGIQFPDEIKDFKKAEVPFVAKPKQYHEAALYPVLVLNRANYDSFTERSDLSKYFYQEYINGKSYYLLYYFYEDGTMEKLSQQNYLQQPDGKSIIGAITADFHKSAESVKYENLFEQLGFRGLVMVEVKQSSNRNHMIEANPRFWGPSQLFMDAGINLFESFLYDWGLISNKPRFQKPKPSRYYWFGGHVESLTSNMGLTYHDYLPENYASEISDWITADIYNRDDSREIFLKEAGLIG